MLYYLRTVMDFISCFDGCQASNVHTGTVDMYYEEYCCGVGVNVTDRQRFNFTAFFIFQAIMLSFGGLGHAVIPQAPNSSSCCCALSINSIVILVGTLKIRAIIVSDDALNM